MNESKTYTIIVTITTQPESIDDVKESLSVHLEKLKMFGDIEECSDITIE